MKENETNLWDDITPKELRYRKIFSVAFLILSILIAFFLNKSVGRILLMVWLFFISGPIFLASKGSIKNMIYVLKKLEPGYNDWNDDDIERQIQAIQKCGYRWYEKKGVIAFKHSRTGLYLKIQGLNFYTPEDIEQVYRNVWSQANRDSLRKKELIAQNLYKAVSDDASNDEIEAILDNYENS